MENIYKILFGLLLLSMLAFSGVAAPVTASTSIDTTVSPNISRAAILVDSSQLTDSNILNNYNRVRATFDYFGYKYDVLPYSTDLNTISPYQMVVALSPTTAGLVKNYTTFTGKWALILGRPAPTLESAYHLTYSSTINAASGSRTRNIITANPMMAIKTIVYYSMYDDYVLGSGVISGATTNDGHKLILTYSGTNGSAVILNSGFDQQLVRNFISVADPTAVLVTGAYPYARDLGIIMRYDDLGDDPASGFLSYYNVSNDCTIAAVVHNTQPSDIAIMPYADFIPHSYDHIDLSTLSDSDMQHQAQMSMSEGTALFGKSPIGFVAPWNYYTYNTTKILYQTGFRYMLVDSGLTTSSNAKDLQYYSSETDPNNQLWLMGYTQQDEDAGYVQQWWIDDSKEDRGYFQVLLHTSGDASIDEATRQRIVRAVYNTTVHDSWFMETSDDYFAHLDDAKKVTVSGNTLQVNGSTIAGLVLWRPSGTSNVVLDNSTATIVSRNHMAMLPALSDGTHTFNYSNSYPHISAYTNGSLINNGYYNIQNSTMYFSIHDDDEIYNRTNVSLTGLVGTTLYLIKDGANVNSFTPTNGNHTLLNLAEGDYIIKNTPLITPSITWNTPADITTETPLSTTQLNAQANVPGTFTYNPVAGTYLSAGQHTLYANFTPNDSVNYSIVNTSVTINVIQDAPISGNNITVIKKQVYGDGGLPRYMGSYAMNQSGSGISLIDSNISSLGSVSTPYYQDNGNVETNYTLLNSSISGVKWKNYYAPGSSALLSFSGDDRSRLENVSLSNDSLYLSNSVTYTAQSLVTKEGVPVTGNAFQFYGDGLNTISGNTLQAYTDNGSIQNDFILNSTGGFERNYYQNRTAGTTRSNSIELPLSSPQLTPMPCPSGYLGSLSFAIHADYQDSDSLKTLMYGTNDTQNPVYGTKGYIGHGLICTWAAFAQSTRGGYGFDNASFKSTLDDMYVHGFEIVPHNVNGDWTKGTPTLTTTAYYLPWYSNNYSSQNWIDHGLNGGNRNTGLKSLGLDNTSDYYIGDLLRSNKIQYAWAYQDINTKSIKGISTSRIQSLGLPYDIVWTNTNFTWDDGTPMYEWTSTYADNRTSLNYFKNDTIQTMINNYGVCFWHDYTAQNDDYTDKPAFKDYYYTKGNPNMITQNYDNLLQNISEQKQAGMLWNPTVSQYIDYWRAACNVECKCTGQNTYTLINHNSVEIPGYAMRVKGSYTVKLDGNALSTKMNGAETVFWMNLSSDKHLLTLMEA